MTRIGELREATVEDCAALLDLWALLFDDTDPVAAVWSDHARQWFIRVVDDPSTACLPVIERNGSVVATAVGTLEVGVPSPHCVRGRTVRLANVFTLPEHRGSGYGTRLVRHVIAWATSIDADRVDLSASALGQSIYAKVGFVPTTAPRMKLVL